MKLKKYKTIRLIAATLVLAAFSALCAGVSGLGFMAQWQLAPALLSTISGVGLSSAVILATLLLTAVLGGRWYCSLWCPVGIFTDLVDLCPIPGKRAQKKDLPFLRFFILMLTISLVFIGLNDGFMLFDPYSNFAGIIGELFRQSFTWGLFIQLAILIGFALWKRRFYCTTICPVGAVLNILSRRTLFKLTLKESCVKCKICEKSCPAGCIDVERQTIDNGRCIRCLYCLDVCKFSAIGFGKPSTPPAFPEPDLSRRDFLKRGSAALGGAVAGGVMLKLGMDKFAPTHPFSPILPPGAGDLKRFADQCTSCLICVQNCPQNIIRPPLSGDGPVSLDLRKNFCDWGCNMCSEICPTGALKDLNLPEKQHTQIALAAIGEKCIGCSVCVQNCPAGAISMLRGRAVVNSDCCAGCGKCALDCPVKAITVTPVPVQKTLPERTTADTAATSNTPQKAVIDANVCFSCGSCAEVCPVKAITLDDSDTPRPVDNAKCIGCGKCITVCPARAIKLQTI